MRSLRGVFRQGRLRRCRHGIRRTHHRSVVRVERPLRRGTMASLTVRAFRRPDVVSSRWPPGAIRAERAHRRLHRAPLRVRRGTDRAGTDRARRSGRGRRRDGRDTSRAATERARRGLPTAGATTAATPHCPALDQLRGPSAAAHRANPVRRGWSAIDRRHSRRNTRVVCDPRLPHRRGKRVDRRLRPGAPCAMRAGEVRVQRVPGGARSRARHRDLRARLNVASDLWRGAG